MEELIKSVFDKHQINYGINEFGSVDYLDDSFYSVKEAIIEIAMYKVQEAVVSISIQPKIYYGIELSKILDNYLPADGIGTEREKLRQNLFSEIQGLINNIK